MLYKFLKTWHLQELITAQIPNPFWPPAPPPFTEHAEFGDAKEIQGFHTVAQGDLSNQQFQAGRGIFTALKSQSLKLNDVLRSKELGLYIKLIDEPIQAPEHSPTQIEKWPYQVVSRSDEELVARRLAGINDFI